MYLAFLDQGACISLTNVTVSFNYCSEISSDLVKFPRTVAPVNDSQLVEQTGECKANSVSKVKLLGACLSSGEWNITDGLECSCVAGYELVNGSASNSLQCNGRYKLPRSQASFFILARHAWGCGTDAVHWEDPVFQPLRDWTGIKDVVAS